MASSLEELLAEEGFRGRKSITRSRSSIRSESLSKTDSPLTSRVKTERTRSDISRYNLGGELSRSGSTTGRRPRDYLVRREKLNSELKKERIEGIGSSDRQDDRWLNINSSEEFQGNEKLKDVFTNEGHSSGRRERDKRNDNGSTIHLLARRSYSDKHQNSLKRRDTAYDKNNRGSQNNKTFEDGQHQKGDDFKPTVSHPALDEVAIQAIVSILSGYIKPFSQDEDFRTALHHSCFSSLNFTGVEEDHNIERKVIVKLEQAIEIVEKSVADSVSGKELKKAALQLSVITGLGSNDLQDSFTDGVPNTMLSSCAHLYLSVIYKLQKKDRVSAKHLLQVFCDSPSQARTNLLPELWDYLFFPHLSHLKAWYNHEADSLSDTPSRERKLKLLEKVYNEIMDSSTFQLAVYYKDWLTEGVKAPSFPSIQVPSVSVGNIQLEVSPAHSPDPASSARPFSPQPMVSKSLYDAVFGRSSKPGQEETEDNVESHYYDTYRRSSADSTVDVKRTLTCSSEALKHPYQDKGEASSKSSSQDDASFLSLSGHFEDLTMHQEDGISSTTEEERRLPALSRLQEKDIHCTNNSFKADNTWKLTTRFYDMPHAPVVLNANALMLKRLAKSAFELQQSDSSDNLPLSILPNPSEEAIPDSLEIPTESKASFEELHESNRYFDEESIFSSIPNDFICPLTGKLFEEPVTLETGQTFERVAIKEWFNQGNRTCPVTGKFLEYLSVPLTNFILKRIIASWKLENRRKTLELAFIIVGNSREHGSPRSCETATFILEQFLTALNREQRIMNTKHLIALGGLTFLIQRFNSGDMEEKTRVAALLSCCIEADSGRRYQIVRDIDKHCLFEVVFCKQVKSRTNAVLLLTELICLSRRKDVKILLSDLQNEERLSTMHALNVYLRSSPPIHRPLVATLLLNIDLLVDPRKYGLYRQEAVDAIIASLDTSLIDEGVREKCCRALLMLSGRFSSSGKLLAEAWILKLAGFDNDEVNSTDKEEDSVLDDTILLEDEECANEEWMRNLSAALVGSGKRSFLEAISKCLGSGHSDLVSACLTTVAWLTGALSSVTNAEFQLSTFSILISRLKQILENDAEVQHKVLASMSLLNFTKISECRVLLMTIAEEIAIPLKSIADVTWTAKELYAIISGIDL